MTKEALSAICNAEQDKADFEAECRRYWGEFCPDLEFINGKYDNNGLADLAWRFWQAATLKANQPPLPVQPQRQWVGLTGEERNDIWKKEVGWGDPSHDDEDLMKAIEQTLKEKNT